MQCSKRSSNAHAILKNRNLYHHRLLIVSQAAFIAENFGSATTHGAALTPISMPIAPYQVSLHASNQSDSTYLANLSTTSNTVRSVENLELSIVAVKPLCKPRNRNVSSTAKREDSGRSSISQELRTMYGESGFVRKDVYRLN